MIEKEIVQTPYFSGTLTEPDEMAAETEEKGVLPRRKEEEVAI